MKVKESDLQKAITDYLRLKKYVVVKFPSVGIWRKDTQSYIKQPRRGVSDILACQPKTGRFVAIEVKIGRNKATSEQLEFLVEVGKCGGIAILTYDLDSVIDGLRNSA